MSTKLSEEQLEAAKRGRHPLTVAWDDDGKVIVTVADLVAEIERLRTCERGPKMCDVEIGRLEARLSDAERKVAYYESALTIDDGELTALRGGGVAKAIKRTRVVDLIGKLAEVEAERDEQGRLKAMLCERKDKLEQEVVRLSRQLAASQAREERLRASLQEIVDEWGCPNTPKWHRARAALAPGSPPPEDR